MRYGGSSNTLLLLAGAIWLAAGANILPIGIDCWSGDHKGWLVMAGMIALGIALRRLELLPVAFIAVFYTGLSLALMATGVRFLIHAWRIVKKEE